MKVWRRSASLRSLVLAVLAISLAGCGPDTVEPSISFEDGSCTSTDPTQWPDPPLEVEVLNPTISEGAIVLGTYEDGFGYSDLLAYGKDVTVRPGFMDAQEVFEVVPESEGTLLLDPDPGTYFVVCMPDANTMIPLGDLTS